MEKKEIQELQTSIKHYLNTNYDLLKLESGAKLSNAGASLLSWVLVVKVIGLLVLFFSLGLAFYVSEQVDSYSLGFFVVGFFYLFMTIVFLILRKTLLERPLRDSIIRNLFAEAKTS